MKTSQPMRIVRVSTLNHPDVRGIVSREPSPSPEVTRAVKGILAGVKAGGHAAALGYARKFDGLQGNLAVSQAELEKKARGLDPQVKRAIKGAIANVRRFHERQAEKSWRFRGPDGETLGQIIRPLNRVGLYVPGGAGVYPSTLIM